MRQNTAKDTQEQVNAYKKSYWALSEEVLVLLIVELSSYAWMHYLLPSSEILKMKKLIQQWCNVGTKMKCITIKIK